MSALPESSLDFPASPNTPAGRRHRLKARIARRDAMLLPGAANALTARIAEDLGFEAVYLTGAGLTNVQLGMPDLGLVTATEIAETSSCISDVCALPLVVDIDTGFGNALNVYRTVQLLERAGAAALQIEDQVFPKKCGHFDGKGSFRSTRCWARSRPRSTPARTLIRRSSPVPTRAPWKASIGRSSGRRH